MIDYELAKREGPKLKAQLTRASKCMDAHVRFNRTLDACKHAVERWDAWGAWPDNWSNWQRALDDACFNLSRATGRIIGYRRLESL